MTSDDAGALRRILEEAGRPDLVDLLADDLSGSDLTTLLLEVMRRRASRVAAPELMRRYGTDRFVAPAVAPFDQVRAAEEALIGSLPPAFEMVELSPLVPLGTHAAMGPVDQNWVVSTIRGTDVAADPTNGLVLEAARRRRELLKLEPRSPDLVRLAATQRVARGQRVEGPVSFAHFRLFGLLTAGRDVGNLTFEREAAIEHAGFAVRALLAAGAERVTIEVTDFEGTMKRVLDAVRDALRMRAEADVIDRPDRPGGRGYYASLCFKGYATLGGDTLEVADGGLVDWTQQLVPSRKERLFISGFGVDRLALLLSKR